MSFFQKIGSALPQIGLVIIAATLVYFYGIFLPFFIALALAYAAGDRIERWQKWLKNWELSVSLYLLAWVLLLVLFFSLSTSFIVRDVQRFGQSFTVLVEQNQDNLDAGASMVKDWIGEIYDPAKLERLIDEQIAGIDSATAGNKIDWESLGEQFKKIPELFGSEKPEEKKFQAPSFSFWQQLSSFIIYFVLILYNYLYFQGLRNRYRSPVLQGTWSQFWRDFEQSFLKYFKLRSRIILWLLPLYLTCFLLLDLPGTFIYLLGLFLLLYIPYFQYLLLIPIALSSLVLSTEIDLSYWWIMAIIIGVFALSSIIEEALLIPRIMERNIGLNPVIMVLGLSFWTYTLGTIGIIIGIPLTSLAIIYIKRFLLPHWFPSSENNA